MHKPRTSSPDDEVATPTRRSARGAEGPGDAGAGFPWKCSLLQSEKGDSIPKGTPLFCEKPGIFEQARGGMCVDSPVASACHFHELLGRLTSEFNRLWASNGELRAENARLRAGRASPGYGPWEAFGFRETSCSFKAGSAAGLACDEGGDLSPRLPRMRSSPSGRPVLRSEREWSPASSGAASAWRRGLEEAENTDRRPTGARSLQLSQAVSVEPVVVPVFESQASSMHSAVVHVQSQEPLQPLQRQISSWTEGSPKNSINLGTKIDDQICPKFLKQGSMASMHSELSLLPAWKKQVRNIGILRRQGTLGAVESGSVPAGASDSEAMESEAEGSSGRLRSKKLRGFIRRTTRGASGSEQNPPWLSPAGTRSRKDILVAEDVICSGDELRETGCLQRFIWRPSSLVCFSWDIVTALIMCYDLVMIPLQVFPLRHIFIDVMDWVLCVVWSLDIFCSFLRGADIGSVVELRPSRIARRYVTSWFVLDLLLVAMDWMILFTAGRDDVDVLRGMRIRRILRVVRIARLLRIVKLASKENLRDVVHSEKYLAILSIGKLLVVIWVINHYVACGWYGIGQFDRETTSWVSGAILPEHPLLYHYATAYHWSMTQFTPASMEVTPTNTRERIYTIVAIFAGLVVFSSFVSNMTHAMTNFQQLTIEQQRQSEHLREFLSTHRVSLTLVDRILLFLKSQNATHLKKRLHERDVGCLKFLPDNLLARMREEVYGRVLVEHPLFMKLRLLEDVCFTHICNLAMSERSLLLGEELFRYGNPGTAMYFLVGGQLSYFPGYDAGVPYLVKAGEWISECALWAKWEHRGRLVADLEVAELMCLSSAEFHAIVLQTRSVLEVQRYARIFCTRAVKDCGSQEHVTDLYGNRTILDAMTRRAFNHGDNSHVINKVMMLWDTRGGVQPANVFTAWKQITQTALQNRKKGKKARAIQMDHSGTQLDASSNALGAGGQEDAQNAEE